MKTFDLNYFGAIHKIGLNVACYESGGLAIQMTDYADGGAEPWSMLTVNLKPYVCPKDCAFIDTNNNGAEILGWIAINGLAAPTGRTVHSGFNTYPEYRFHAEMLRELDPEGYRVYLHHLKCA